MRYSDVVDYDILDPVKRKALKLFQSTFGTIEERLRIRVAPVGETAAVLDFLDYDFMLAFNVEGLGTKNVIADTIYQELINKKEIADKIEAKEAYRFIGQDTVAMSLIDLLAVGADPIAYGDLISAGDSNWFDDLERVDELLFGYKVAAELAGCAIPCGETPTLQNVVYPETLDLAGASVGIIKPKSRFMYGQKIKEGDCIYGLPSGGICSNGVSKARAIAEKLPDGYFTKLPNGRELGKELLTPTPIFVRPVIEMLDKGVDLHYIAPITGHGWKKIARARFPFTYVIEKIPEPPIVFQSLIEFGKKFDFDVSDRENYQVWNMGVFIVLIAPEVDEDKMRLTAEEYKTELFKLGVVEKGEKQVVIKPKKVIYKE